MIKNMIKFEVKSVEGDIIELCACGCSKGVSIRGCGLISKSEFQEKLPALRAFPLCYPVILCSAGIWSDDGSSLEIEHLGIYIENIGNTGRLMLRLRLFEEDFEYGDLGYGCGGRLDFHVNYSDLSGFLDGFTSLISGQSRDFEFSSFADW